MNLPILRKSRPVLALLGLLLSLGGNPALADHRDGFGGKVFVQPGRALGHHHGHEHRPPGRGKGHDHGRHHSSTIIVAPTLGLWGAARPSHDRYYVGDYQSTTVVIDRHKHGRSISLFKDRYGACYERETDRHGHLVSRRVSDHYCSF